MRTGAMIALAVVSLMQTALPVNALADAYPLKPVTYIIGWGAGSAADLDSRLMCNEASKHLPQPFVLQSKVGSSGALAYNELHRAKPDGYTIGTATMSLITHQKMNTLPFGIDSFEPIIGVSADPTLVCVPADSPFKTVQDLLDAARKRPGEVTMGVSPPGASMDIAASLLEHKAGVKFRKVAHQEAVAQVMTALAGGHLEAAMGNGSPTKTMVDAGKIRVIGVMHSKRLDTMPDVPTLAEIGYPITTASFRMIVAPKGTPKDVLKTLYEAFKKAQDSEKYTEFVNSHSGAKLMCGLEECREYYAAITEELDPVLKELMGTK